MNFYRFVKGLVSLAFKIIFKIRVQGLENVPVNSRAVICSNHISLLDPLLLAVIMPRKVQFMAKKELFSNKLLKLIVSNLGAFPVDRDGADLSAIRNSIKVLKDECLLGIFPEGTRVKDINTSNVKPGIAMISIKGKAPIIPVFIQTEYKFFKRINVLIGKPIYFSEYYDKKLNTDEYKFVSQKIMDTIYDLEHSLSLHKL